MSQITVGTIRRYGSGSVLKLDILWVSMIAGISVFLLTPAGNEMFSRLSASHVYLMAFVKFAVLATMGELLAARILQGTWVSLVGLLWRALIWGLLGILIALVFHLYATGVAGAQQNGLLPSGGGTGLGSRFLFAFFTSSLMNLLFAPTFMAFHRVTDAFIDMGDGKLGKIVRVKLHQVLERIDWSGFISFVVCRTIPLFWIPVHTLTFLLPSEHRVLAAAFLSIALGAILAVSKRRS